MPPFVQNQRKSQLGKLDRWILNYLTLAAVFFASCYSIGTYIIQSDYYTQGIVAVLFGILLIKALAVPTVRSAHGERATIFLALMFTVAMINMLISWNPLESSLRWVLWFGTVVCLSRISSASDGSWVEAVIGRLPFMFAFIYLTLIATAHFFTPEDAYSAFHLSGLYGNLMLAAGLFAGKSWQRVMWSTFGFIAIYFSGAGGALFTIPIMFVPYILYSATSMPVKGFVVASLFAIGVFSFYESQLFSNFLDIKVNAIATGSTYTGAERLEHSKDMRLQLVEYGLLLVEENPLGTGLGHTYNKNMFDNAGVGSAHNGTISMLIELGIPGFAIVLCLMAWMFLCIFQNKSVPTNVRAFYFTFFFTMFGRSLSENYAPLDMGNYFNFVFLIFSSYLLLNQKVQRAPAYGPAHPRGRMLMRPGLRPLLPRPVVMR